MIELIYRQYRAQKKRKKITRNTKNYEFMLKLEEETIEALNEFNKFLKNQPHNLWQELFDVIWVCINFMIFSRVNIKKEARNSVEWQEKRSN